jgi:hypothetical protein
MDSQHEATTTTTDFADSSQLADPKNHGQDDCVANVIFSLFHNTPSLEIDRRHFFSLSSNEEETDQNYFMCPTPEAKTLIASMCPWLQLPGYSVDRFEIDRSRLDTLIPAINFFTHHSYSLSEKRFLYNRYKSMTIPPPSLFLASIIDLHQEFLAFQDLRRSNPPSDEERILDADFSRKANAWLIQHLEEDTHKAELKDLGLFTEVMALVDVLEEVNSSLQRVVKHDASLPYMTVTVTANDDGDHPMIEEGGNEDN